MLSRGGGHQCSTQKRDALKGSYNISKKKLEASNKKKGIEHSLSIGALEICTCNTWVHIRGATRDFGLQNIHSIGSVLLFHWQHRWYIMSYGTLKSKHKFTTRAYIYRILSCIIEVFLLIILEASFLQQN